MSLPGPADDARSPRAFRIADPAYTPSAGVRFRFDGVEVHGLEGETIAAALAAAGIVNLGRRRDGSGRGLWCGMGVCQECIVTVNGVPSVRACMTKVQQDASVEAQGYAAQLPTVARAAPCTVSGDVRRPQVLIVGAGPAGLSAARAAALCGATVTVLDERSTAGGQYFKQVAPSHAVSDPTRIDAQARTGRALIDEVERLGVQVLRDATVWAGFAPKELAITKDGAHHVMSPERLILATGAYERGEPLPGWTLPGFMTTGAAQTLLRAYRVVPGQRVLVAGNGPLNLQLAAELVSAGVNVVAVVEAAPAHRLRHAATIARAALAAPALIWSGLRYRRRLSAAGVPVFHESAVTAAEGDARVEACTVARIDRSGTPVPGTSRRFVVDTVCVSHGFLPSNTLARSLGCRHARDRTTGILATVVDEEGRTSVPDVYAIGDGVRLMGAHVARHQGFVTGCSVARSLGLSLSAAVGRERSVAHRRLRSHRSFQKALWRLFAAPRLKQAPQLSQTVVCRCEHVAHGAIAQALHDGATSVGAVKRRTRAGMGRCQGRYCESMMARMLADAGVDPGDELSSFAPRVPIVPVRVDELL